MESAFPTPAADQQRTRLYAILAAFMVGAGLMAGKFFVYRLTGSAAIFSDALEPSSMWWLPGLLL